MDKKAGSPRSVCNSPSQRGHSLREPANQPQRLIESLELLSSHVNQHNSTAW